MAEVPGGGATPALGPPLLAKSGPEAAGLGSAPLGAGLLGAPMLTPGGAGGLPGGALSLGEGGLPESAAGAGGGAGALPGLGGVCGEADGSRWQGWLVSCSGVGASSPAPPRPRVPEAGSRDKGSESREGESLPPSNECMAMTRGPLELLVRTKG